MVVYNGLAVLLVPIVGLVTSLIVHEIGMAQPWVTRFHCNWNKLLTVLLTLEADL